MTLAAIEESRLKGGVLTLDGDPFEKQATDVALVPSVAGGGENVETLSGATLAADETYTWVLSLGLIQDFDDPAGLVEFLRSRMGETVAYTWEPNQTGAPTYGGDCLIRPTTIGGKVNTRLTGTVELPATDTPDPTYPA